nr:MAG TPA: hypothetical protein [Caudoviricetes sp.]
MDNNEKNYKKVGKKMIIVNQNKTVIMNFNNTNYIAISDDEPLIFARTNNNSEITLAIYKTKERAKEVLKEIVEAYVDRKKVRMLKQCLDIQ